MTDPHVYGYARSCAVTSVLKSMGGHVHGQSAAVLSSCPPTGEIVCTIHYRRIPLVRRVLDALGYRFVDEASTRSGDLVGASLVLTSVDSSSAGPPLRVCLYDIHSPHFSRDRVHFDVDLVSSSASALYVRHSSLTLSTLMDRVCTRRFSLISPPSATARAVVFQRALDLVASGWTMDTFFTGRHETPWRMQIGPSAGSCRCCSGPLRSRDVVVVELSTGHEMHPECCGSWI